MAETTETRSTPQRLIEIAWAPQLDAQPGRAAQLIMGSAAELLGAETSSLLLVDEEAGDLIVDVATGASGERSRARVTSRRTRASPAGWWRTARR